MAQELAQDLVTRHFCSSTVMALINMGVLAAVFMGSAHAAAQPDAAEFRRWEGTGECIGEYSVLSRDNMDECTPYHLPAPASIWIEQKNDTAYSSYHFQGPTDCSGAERTFLSDWIVDECFDYGDYSQKRVWITKDDGAVQI